MLKWNICMFLLIAGLSLLTKASGESSSSSEDSSDSSYEDPIIPRNRNSSIQYFLYTPENTKKACYIEPRKSFFDNCYFNSSYETKFIIHGYQIKLSPGNLFEKMKDTLLAHDNYNVILVNWTLYNQQKYDPDVVNAYIVGVDVSYMIKFLMSHAGVSASSIHLIGHSLGAQIAGTAGKHVTNLGRITGLDPAGPGYNVNVVFDRLSSTDAQLVDAIHTSNPNQGFGTDDPIAWMNFYPDGGSGHPKCQVGNTYLDGDGVQHTIRTYADQAGCNHDSSITFFISSILDCKYISTLCLNYENFNNGECKSQAKNRMGLDCVEMPGLLDHSKFYLNTSATYPYC